MTAHHTSKPGHGTADSGTPRLPSTRHQAIAQILSYNLAIGQGRKEYGGFQDGTIVDLRNRGHRSIVLFGDLHAREENLDRILNRGDILPRLREDRVILVPLGDLIHNHRNLAEMDSSFSTLARIMDLKIRFPKNVFPLLGNHDFTKNGVAKGSTSPLRQDELFRERATQLYGEDYLRLYTLAVEQSPLMMLARGLVAVHAAPITTARSLEEIRDVPVRDDHWSRQHPIVRQATWSRWEYLYGEGYTQRDVVAFLKRCGQQRGQLIVSHSPVSQSDWHWQRSYNHHVIYAANDRVGYVEVPRVKPYFVEC